MHYAGEFLDLDGRPASGIAAGITRDWRRRLRLTASFH
jgi:hypothetical protein